MQWHQRGLWCTLKRNFGCWRNLQGKGSLSSCWVKPSICYGSIQFCANNISDTCLCWSVSTNLRRGIQYSVCQRCQSCPSSRPNLPSLPHYYSHHLLLFTSPLLPFVPHWPALGGIFQCTSGYVLVCCCKEFYSSFTIAQSPGVKAKQI